MSMRVLVVVLLAMPASADEVDAAVKKLIEREAIAGAVTLIEHKGKIVHYSAHGEAAPGVPMSKNAVFRIYSMTKPITAVAALLLVEEKKLVLDAPVSKYLPAFKELKVSGGEAPKRAMTLRDLFCHTSGLIYGWERTDVGRLYTRSGVRRSKTLTDLIEKLGRIPLAHQPGSKWHYSISSDVLGAVVEVVAKRPLDEFFRERIFKPLEMTDTGFFVRAKDRFTANYGRGLRVIDAPDKSKFLAKPTNLSGGGGLVSTTNDYLKFCRMLLRGGKPLLNRETVAEMTRNQLAKELVPIRVGGVPLPGTGFGLGVAVRLTDAIPDAVGEFSWGGAASTNFSVVPKRELIIITMTQRMPMTPFLFYAVRPLAYRMTAPKQVR